ncbi:MAG: serine--tRNA ligase [Thermoplasmata archaeon]|nr:serine--tRNA ligase [Thermoplasmata archaeon]
MKFELKGSMKFSGNVEAAKKEIEDAMTALVEEIVEKSKGKGTASMKISSIKNDNIELSMESQVIRAHEILLRLGKRLGEVLAKHKLGVRGLNIESYKVVFELEEKPIKPISIPFASEVSTSDNTCTMTLKDVDEEFLRKNYIDRMIKLVREKSSAQHYEGKGKIRELLWQAQPGKMAWDKDPSDEMLKMGWLKQGPSKGRWFFKPQAAKIMRTMEMIAEDEILGAMGFQEVIESHIETMDILIKTGHLEGTPMERYYIVEPKTRTPEDWERFMDLVKITRQVPKEELSKLLTQPEASGCFAQCPVIYWGLSNLTIAHKSLPLLVYDGTANSSRYESGGRHGIERVDEFHRLEPVFIGTPEQAVEVKDKLIERYKHVFDDILELEWRMAWVTPFYMEQAGVIPTEEDEKKVIGTIDFEAYMPYRGTREESEWLEFQNLTIVGDKYTKAFNIKTQKGDLWSGCSGIGLERWTAAFLSQHSLEPKDWPPAFRERIGELPKGIETL